MMSARGAISWAALGAAASAAMLMTVGTLRGTGDAEDQNAAGDHAAAAPASPSPRDGQVRLAPAAQRRLGLRLTPAVAASAPSIARGFARGLDAGPLAAIDAEIAGANAAASASAAEARRLASLAAQDQSASAKAVEAARAQAVADAARVRLAERRIGLEYGPGLARLAPGRRHALITEIADGSAALVRIDIPGARIETGALVRIDGGGAPALLGPAATADSRLQSAGVLAVLTGPAAATATSGRLLGASVATGATQTGVTVSRDAILRWRGGLWVYRQTGPERFERVELVAARPVGDRWFVGSGLAPGDRIVTSGAGGLLGIDGHGSPSERTED